MLGIGFGELLVIAAIVVIAVGPDKMPGFLRTVVKGVRDFRRTTNDLRNAVRLDQILDPDDLNLHGRALPTPRRALSDYERQRENPIQGPDIEHAYRQHAEMDADTRREYPPEGPDILFAQREMTVMDPPAEATS